VRILVVQESDWIDRNPVVHHRMLEELSRNGDEVRVVDFDIMWHTKGRRPLVQRRQVVTGCTKFFEDATVTVVRPGMVRLPAAARPSRLVANVPELRRAFREYRPDVVVAYSITNAWVAQRLARRHRVPFVMHVLDALHTLAEPSWLHPVAAPVERRVLRAADEVIVINKKLGDYAVEMGAAPERVHMIPIGVDTAEPPEEDARAVRSSLGIAEDELVLLFMGWLYRFSGLVELVEELARRRDELPRARLVVVGDGDVLEELSARRDRLGLGDRVVLTGRQPKARIPAFLAAADVCLLPARRTATMEHIVPTKVVEYLQAGKAVIATRLPGLEAEFDDLEGLLYIEDVRQAVDHAARLSAHPDPRAEAARLGATCRAFMERREDWDTVTRRFADVVHSARSRWAGEEPISRRLLR
jgi:glycosyltransferase involved in cell wall biosynthesis